MFIETFATDYVPLLLLNESHWKIAIRKMLRFSVENRLPIRRTKFEVDYTQIEYHLWLSLDYEERNKICNWFWFAHFSFTGLVPPSGWWFQMQTHSRHNLNEIQSNAFHFEWGKRWKALILQFKCHLKFHSGAESEWHCEASQSTFKTMAFWRNSFVKDWAHDFSVTGQANTSNQMVFINLYNFLKASESMIYRF